MGLNPGAADKENVLIAAGGCALKVPPPFAGNIASLSGRSQELLQPPLTSGESCSRQMHVDSEPL
jgi:hypothetical protein